MSEVKTACLLIQKDLTRKINKLSKKLEEVNLKNGEALKEISVSYKDLTFVNEEEIQEAYGVGYITEARMEALITELERAKEEAAPAFISNILEAEIRILVNIRSNVEYTIKQEELKEDK